MGDEVDEDAISPFVDEYNCLLSLYMHIPFPEQLDEDLWIEKVRQLKWAIKNKLLPIQIKFSK